MVAGLLSTGLMAGGALAEETPRLITVSGQGQVDAVPDMATITLGVTHEHAEAGQAMDAVSLAMTEMLSRLKALGLEDRQIQTTQITLNPLWANRNHDSNSAPRITGFVASNAVSVNVLDLDHLGRVMDAVLTGGANDFNGLRFGLQEPEPLMSQARAKAVDDAIRKARELATAAGIELGDVMSITEHGGGRVTPVHAEMSARAASVPVAAGEMAVTVGVNMVFEIEDAE
ncbi:MAG: DUF541 domain-containing protein [Rhodobacteraceae bacterium]|nr:DUF541 domain-containing protein [Paracoccaceae bacterium]